MPDHPTHPDIDLLDGDFYAGDPFPLYAWMRENSSPRREHDLNPVRAGITDSPERSRRTSVRRRVNPVNEDALAPIGTSTSRIPVSLEAYLDILRWTIASQSGRRSAAPASLQPVLQHSGRSSAEWLAWMQSQRLGRRAYGNAQTIKDYTASIGQLWVRQ